MAAAFSGATSSTLTITDVSDSDAGIYSATVTNLAGSVTSSNVTLTVNDLPFIAAQPQSQTVLAGANVTLNVTVYGAPPFVFQWYFKGTPFGVPAAGTTFSSCTLTNVGSGQAGNYSVLVVNDYGSATSSDALLRVIVPPTVTLKFWAGYPVLNLGGMLGSNFVVQYSTNLAGTNWMNLLSLTNLPASPYLFLDSGGVGQPARFYRRICSEQEAAFPALPSVRRCWWWRNEAGGAERLFRKPPRMSSITEFDASKQGLFKLATIAI